ncbi:sensor histidine kinase [Cohnella sp.]|uniref:cache domain-containing sensor histidine kinase n=1 Tax=Cohnella sp. TaxID=1883426 RepID=UPI003567F818
MGNPFKKFRVDNLFFGSFAFLIVIMIGAAIWTSYSLTSNELATTASSNQHNLLNMLNNEITTRLTTIEQISLSTSRDNVLISLLSGSHSEDEFARYQQFKEVKQSLASLTNSIPLIEGIDVYMHKPQYGDSESYIQFRNLEEASRQYWAESVKRNDMAWTDEYRRQSFQGEVAVLSFVRTILNNNKLIGYLVMHVKADMLKEVLAGHSTGQISRMLLDASGNPILHIGSVPDGDSWSRRAAEMQGQSGVFRIQDSQSDSGSLLVYSRSRNSDWTMVELTPWSQITKGSLKLTKAIAAIGAVAILLTVILTMLISRQFTKPIKKLVGAMNQYSLEGENAKLPEDYENEFGYLFSGYRKQNEKIQELVQSLRQRHELQRRAEIDALQANINPHFLYNTLDQLNWMAIANGQEEISRILELMGRMFRIGLSNGNTFITVHEEMEHLSSYIEIQQIRFSGLLQFRSDIPEGLGSCYMPKMVLQPFVENAIIHGFHHRSQGEIEVVMRRLGDQLLITIEDDGVGLRSGGEPAVHKKSGGYGIRNVEERISAYFGNKYGVALNSREGGGTRVIVRLPLLEEQPERQIG